MKTHVSRRNLLKLGAGALGTGVFAATVGSKVTFPEPAVAQNDMSPDDAIKMLMDGNERFVLKKRTNPHQDMARLTEVAKGQHPFASVLSCADSRVPVEIIFDQGLGDIFVVRNAGNIVTPEETGSLEFGSLVLGTKVLMILGHKSCGAVMATLKGGEFPGQIGSIVAAIQPAVSRIKGQAGDELENATKANVVLEIERITASPVISKLIEEGKLKVIGGVYDLDTGKVNFIS
jgi:carbonic anhydrase